MKGRRGRGEGRREEERDGGAQDDPCEEAAHQSAVHPAGRPGRPGRPGRLVRVWQFGGRGHPCRPQEHGIPEDWDSSPSLESWSPLSLLFLAIYYQGVTLCSAVLHPAVKAMIEEEQQEEEAG